MAKDNKSLGVGGGEKARKEKRERDAPREHFSCDGLHTPISPMKSSSPSKELNRGVSKPATITPKTLGPHCWPGEISDHGKY